MSGTVDEQVSVWLAVSERERSCYVAQSADERRCLNRRVGKGVVRPAVGLYAAEEIWKSLEPDEQGLRIIRGMAGQKPGIAFCGASAAIIHGLDVPWRDVGQVHVAQRHGGCSRSCGQLVRHECEGELVDVDGVMVTPFWRTVADCLRWLPFPDALAVADSALKEMGCKVETLVAQVEEEAHGKTGKARAVEVAAFADARSDNAGESLARGVMLEAGFVRPVLQFEIPDLVEPWHNYYIDYAWLDQDGAPRVFGELDGYRKTENAAYMGGRSAERVLLDERRRESRISLYGVPIVRFTLAQALRDWEFELLLDSYGVPRAA